MSSLLEILLSGLVLLGAAFVLIGSIALTRLDDFFSRLHGPTKATTLGTGAILIASSVYFSVLNPGISLHEILITLFLFMTAPIGAHLLAKAALHMRISSVATGSEHAMTSGERGRSRKEQQ